MNQRRPAGGPTVGVLALQGAVGPHVAAVEALGAGAVLVRRPGDLDGVDGLVLPGGESTTMSLLLESSGLFDPLAERIAGGMPVLGTCAGMLLLASEILDGRPDQRSFGAIDVAARRNAFGRQVDSFEADLDVDGMDEPFHAVFIRAPYVEAVGQGVEVLARVGEHPVYCRQGPVVVTSFHPELVGDLRIHDEFLRAVVRGRTTEGTAVVQPARPLVPAGAPSGR